MWVRGSGLGADGCHRGAVRCLVAWTQSGARTVSPGSHQRTAVSLPTNSAREQQSDRNQMTDVGTESWDCWAGSRTVWTPFVRRGRGGFGSEPKETVSSSLGPSVDFRICHRGTRSGPSLTRLGRGDLLVMDCLAQSEHEQSTSSDPGPGSILHTGGFPRTPRPAGRSTFH